MSVEITPPPAGVYDWRVPCVLGGVTCAIRWRWNEPWLVWQIWCELPGGASYGPVAACPGRADLFELFKYAPIPQGALTVESQEQRPGETAFGTSARLLYG